MFSQAKSFRLPSLRNHPNNPPSEKVTPADFGIETLISNGTTFVGNFESSSGMKIDGNIVGNVKISNPEKDVWAVVSSTGCVDGNIDAGVVAVYGKVTGSIRARTVTLIPGAQVDGDIYYEIIKIGEGANVTGRMVKETNSSFSSL